MSSLTSYNLAYLNQEQAKQLDQRLFQSWDVAQLMELAGLSVACAVFEALPPLDNSKVLIIAGPGNNGGDGVVAARHLFHFGYSPTIVYPKVGKSDLFTSLIKQCSDLGIKIEETLQPEKLEYDFILDAVFGFSFNPTRGVRAPYDTILSYLRQQSQVPVVSIDVPSGWDVEKGDVHGIGCVIPFAIVSLTAPKQFVHTLPSNVRHFLGGRFLPPDLSTEYGLNGIGALYSGSQQYVELANINGSKEVGEGEGEGKL